MKLFTLLTLSATLLMSNLALAEKVAVFGAQEAVITSQAGKDFAKRTKEELNAERQQVIELEKQAKALQDELKTKGADLSQEEAERKQLQLRKVFTEFQRKGQALQQMHTQKQQEFFAAVRPQLEAVL